MILATVDDKKQIMTANMAEIVFFRGASEIQYVIFQQNNVNPNGIYNKYIELSIDFHNMIIFFENSKIQFLPTVLGISCIVSC